MPQRRFLDRPDHDLTRQEQAEAPPAPAGEAAQLLALQRSAGNAAVARMLAAPSVSVAREDGYTMDAPSDAGFDATDSLLEDSGAEQDSEEESADPDERLTRALAARIADKGTAGTRPAFDEADRYTAMAPTTDGSLTSESEGESTSSETDTEETSISESVSDDTPVTERAIEVAAQIVAEDASDSPSELSDDLASEVSSDASESAGVSGDETASSSSGSSRASAPAPAQAVPASPPLAAVGASAPAPVKKSAVKRALKALAKPARALKKIFKGKKRKDLPTAAQLLADADAADVAETGSASSTTASSSGKSTSRSKSRSRRTRRTSQSESTAVTVVQGALDVTEVQSAASVPDTSAGVSADDESLSTAATTTQPTAAPVPATAAADPNRAAPVKYDKLLSTLIPVGEADDSSQFMNVTLLPHNALLQDMSRQGLIPMKSKMPPIFDDDAMAAVKQDAARIEEGLKRVWGWNDEDVRKYFVFESHTAKGTKVEFIRSEADLKRYVVHPGTTMTYGERNDVFDTGKMVSKASGPGFAIFVMDPQGNIYAGQHRVGLFHHSSFTAGRDVVAAGEMKVTGGKLEELTSKSGHYQPTPENTWEVVKHMAGLGVSFAGAQIKNWVPHEFTDKDGKKQKMMITVFNDGEEFLRLGPQARVTRKEFMYGAK